MAEEEYQIPIFFINGQLDSGKTRFITETIEMGQFAEAKNKLLIVCEEGEEEYDEKMLKDNGVSMVVLEKEDLTEEKLKELDKQYDPATMYSFPPVSAHCCHTAGYRKSRPRHTV